MLSSKNKIIAVPSVGIREGLIIGILFFIQFTYILDFTIIMPMAPVLSAVFGLTPAQFSLLISINIFSAAVSGIGASFIIDKLDRKDILLLLYFGFVIGILLTALSTSFWFLIAGRMITGAFGGVLSSTVMSAIGDYIPPTRRGKATGIVMSAFSAASIIGVPFCLYIADRFLWHLPFNITCLLSSVVLLIAYIYLPNVEARAVPVKNDVKPLKIKFSKSERYSLLFMCMLMLSGGFTIFPFVSTYLVNNVKFSQSQLSMIFFMGGCFTAVTGPFIGRLTDLVGKRKVFRYVTTASIFPVFLVTLLPEDAGIIAFLIMGMFFILMNARYISATSLITGTISPERRGRFMSMCSALQQFTGAVATAAVGYFLTSDTTGALTDFHLVGIISVAATILTIFLSYKIKVSW